MAKTVRKAATVSNQGMNPPVQQVAMTVQKVAMTEKKVKDAVARRKASKAQEFLGVLCVNRESKAEWEITEPLNMVRAMLEIGYEIAEEGQALFKDPEGNFIKLTKNVSNRPFRPAYAKRYMLDILRRKWYMNGETIIHDEEGMVQSGQHRYVGLIWACMEWKKHPELWKKYWETMPEIECLIFKGISSDRDVVNSIDVGQKRTLGDVLFREPRFPKDMPYKKKQNLANILAGAARLVWIRSQGKSVSDAPHYPHSEALQFIEEQPELVTSVFHIWAAEGGAAADGRNVTRYISMAYAAGMHYLMATSATDRAEYDEKGPSALNFSMKDRADMFWDYFATGKLPPDHPISVLKKMLLKTETGTSRGRDEILSMVTSAFNIWMDEGDKARAKPQDIEPVVEEDPETGRRKMTSDERLGGIDVAEVSKKTKATGGGKKEDTRQGKRKGKEWKKGDTAWVTVDGGDTYFGKVTEAFETDDGVKMVNVEDDDKEVWESTVDRLFIDKPE